MVRLSDEQFECVCRILLNQPHSDFNVSYDEDITDFTLILENVNTGDQIRILIDMYGKEIRREFIKFDK